MSGFQDQVVFVGGGGSGIGAAVAARFAEAGASVVIGDVKIEQADETSSALRAKGLQCEAARLDVTDEAAVEALFGEVVQRHGGLDHVVSCAGIASRHTIGQMPVETWRRVIDVNLTGAFIVTKFAESALARRGGGSISLISSVAAEHVAYQSGAHYAASKTALIGFARHAGFELGRRHIRVNAVGPGPMTNRMGGGQVDPERQRAVTRNLPLQRMVEPVDIAETCLFLASPGARAITGAYIPVDSGFLTSRGAPYQRYFEAHDEAFE